MTGIRQITRFIQNVGTEMIDNSQEPWHGGSRTYKCPQCRDTGQLVVYHPRHYREILNGCFDSSAMPYMVAAGCDRCTRGEGRVVQYGTKLSKMTPSCIPISLDEKDAQGNQLSYAQHLLSEFNRRGMRLKLTGRAWTP